MQIAPLAYMRGRTLDNAFVILDEAQNTTLPQIKMFLTRMGRNAKFIVTGDVTQIDLPRRSDSGLTRGDGDFARCRGGSASWSSTAATSCGIRSSSRSSRLSTAALPSKRHLLRKLENRNDNQLK